ncbi:hypothetical protein ZOSMA_2G01530 [Zostera marina]|uniref:Uncharacterized protein n=1 Tax=Zostera marina TaxID=29655 RepID=A0A0K9PB02_ZOSMR|nr:hypothetical protein ZOSMA_2G01530 [Zostera marina]
MLCSATSTATLSCSLLSSSASTCVFSPRPFVRRRNHRDGRMVWHTNLCLFFDLKMDTCCQLCRISAKSASKEGALSVLSHSEDLERFKNSRIYPNPANDFEKQLEELFTEIMNMLRIGNRNDALYLLQANHQAVKEQISSGIKTIEQAAILDVVALGYVAYGDQEILDNLLRMLSGIVDNLKDHEQPLDSILIHMGSMYTTLGRFDEAMRMYGRSLEILEHFFGKQSPFLVMGLLGKAKVLKSTGRVTEAIDTYHQTVNILEKNRGTESEELVIPLFALGDLQIDEGMVLEAEYSFKRIYTIYSKSYGENDGRVGMALCSLAHAVFAKGNLEEAISMYRKGLDIIKDSKYLHPNDDDLVKMKVDLAELLHIAGRNQEGRELLEECLLIAEKCKGEDHPSLVTHIINLATSHSHSKNLAEAERLLRVGLRLISKTVGVKDQSITVPMLHLAIVLYNLKRDKEAERYALEALNIREEAFGMQSLPVAEALDCVISIQMRLEKDDSDLLAQLKRLLSIQENELGYDNEDVMMTLKKIVFFLDKMCKKEEILPIKRRLTLLQNKYIG